MRQRGEGFICAIEGIDQSGKRTQTRRLVDRLAQEGRRVETLSFPVYSTPVGQLIKASLEGYSTHPPQVKHMLLAANRWEMQPALKKWLAEEKIVILDRYSASNYAYGQTNGLPLTWLTSLERGLPKPHITILLDITPYTSLRRKSSGRDTHERDLNFLSKVSDTYHVLARRFNWTTINGEKTSEEIHRDIYRAVEKHL